MSSKKLVFSIVTLHFPTKPVGGVCTFCWLVCPIISSVLAQSPSYLHSGDFCGAAMFSTVAQNGQICERSMVSITSGEKGKILQKKSRG